MDIKNIVSRLKQSEYKRAETDRIIAELRFKPYWEKIEILGQLRNEANKSDNSDIIDVINDIINELTPKK